MNKHHLGLILLLIFLNITSVNADVLRWPKLCSQQTLTIENKSSKSQIFWLQSWDSHLISELDYNLDAKTKIDITLTYDLQNPMQNYSLLQLQDSLKNNVDFKISTHCLTEDNTSEISSQNLDGGYIYYRADNESQLKLQLVNLYPNTNTFTIEELGSFGAANTQTQKITLKPRETYNMNYVTHKNSIWLRVSAQERFTLHTTKNHKPIAPAFTQTQKSSPSTEGKYFLVGNRDNTGDQFVVRITNPDLIAKAYEVINNPRLEKIVFATVVLGHQGFNRNFNKKEKSFWSWSTGEVTNISDFGSTSCNGFPQLIEDRAEFWINSPGRICFWNYRIKKELSLKEITQ